MIIEWVQEHPYIVIAGLWGLARACGKTIRTGENGLFFNLGRATRVLEPGFVLKIPIYQNIRVMPTRSRTMDLPTQTVTSHDGLVYHVDANMVYRVTDIRKALIEIDDLQKGMLQILGLTVQTVIRNCGMDDMRQTDLLNARLVSTMSVSLEPWGVAVERAGFKSINPSAETMKITQLKRSLQERRHCFEVASGMQIPKGITLPLLGASVRIISRRKHLTRREHALARTRMHRVIRGVCRIPRGNRWFDFLIARPKLQIGRYYRQMLRVRAMGRTF